ncbi:MAG: PD40 domain-containing protein [Gemmatimonadetes bacterium]|nr:PD40 domain-containing protein [Gemmatimonadota bacterium]
MNWRQWIGAVASGAALTTVVLAERAEAQMYFGQNQVQFDRFRWKVLETEHFLVHYYPEEQAIITDAARMAERSYGRLSRMLNHQFREKKPLILFRSRTDFGQNNVTGDLGEGTGGVTEALRHRILLPFTGDFKTFEHVLAHELVHAFQYDIFARGRAGGGLQTLQQVQPPLWFMEGMAEYLSLGPNHILTQSWVRDASLNGTLPTIEQMTFRPDLFFPYRYGEALWEYVGGRWGDDVIGEIMNSVPNVGIDRSFKRELGLSLEELSDEWREAMQVKHLPQVATLDRARKFAEPLLNARKTGGFSQLFIAPSFSSDGKYIAFIAQGSFLRGEVFPDLWLGDGETGKRIKRLVKSNLNPDFEELRLLYSQSAFSPDGRELAFTAQKDGKDVLYLMDVKRRRIARVFDKFPLDVVMSPAWSPDGKQIVFQGYNDGINDLWIVDVTTGKLRQLTNDKFAEMMPQWSPDGKTIAFTTDRTPKSELEVLKFEAWQIGTFDLATSKIEILPNQDGLNLNPMWSPDGKSLAFVSDRTGIQNVFLYDFDAKEHFQLTNVIGAISAITEVSPAITWARQADRLAFTYYEKGDYTIWSVANPRRLKGKPYRPAQPVVASATPSAAPAVDPSRAAPAANAADMLKAIETATRAADSARANDRQLSIYRSATGLRSSAETPGASERSGNAPISVAQILDSASLALPDTTRFKTYEYRPGLQPEYISRPSIGYAQDNFGRGIFGGTAIVLGDMLGNNRLTLAGQVNGRLSEAYFYGAYMNMGSRLQYMTGASQTPYFFLNGYNELPLGDGSARTIQSLEIARFMFRQGFAIALRPSNRFTRWEYGLNANNVSRSIAYVRRGVDYTQGFATDFITDSVKNLGSLSYVAPYAAYVSDNTLFGYTGAISGRRYRFQVEPSVGGLQWTEYTADYRRYVPILFNFLTFAVRGQSSIAIGKDEAVVSRKYIGRPDFVRGYDREQFASQFCGGVVNDQSGCSATELLGTRVAFANIEMRFPLIRRFDLGLLPISLPPVDGLVFYDAGAAWSKGQSVSFRKPDGYDENTQRFVLRSYGAGIRLNLFGFALVRWDYAIPLDRPNKKGYWMWTLGQSF